MPKSPSQMYRPRFVVGAGTLWPSRPVSDRAGAAPALFARAGRAQQVYAFLIKVRRTVHAVRFESALRALERKLQRACPTRRPPVDVGAALDEVRNDFGVGVERGPADGIGVVDDRPDQRRFRG